VTIHKPNSAGSKPDLKAIGRRVRQIRGFEMRQVELAKALGITQAQLSKYERGQNAPTLELLLKLKRLSGKSIDWIVAGDL
jgi:transcriptional regulator with XRE-family HTH domain